MSRFSKWLRAKGLRKPKSSRKGYFPYGFDDEAKATFVEAKPYTMTDQRRVLALIQAVKYIESVGIAGDVVECGVFKGGSMMVAARTLLNLGSTGRQLYLFDTFEGMPEPGDKDASPYQADLQEQFQEKRFDDGAGSDWAFSPLEEVQRNLGSVGYPEDRVTYVKGMVEDTVEASAPERIALLRLDTDWYASTKHELVHLFPRLEVGGVLIVDDYFYHEGARLAVDEYLDESGVLIFLCPVAGGACIGVKQAPTV